MARVTLTTFTYCLLMHSWYYIYFRKLKMKFNILFLATNIFERSDSDSWNIYRDLKHYSSLKKNTLTDWFSKTRLNIRSRLKSKTWSCLPIRSPLRIIAVCWMYSSGLAKFFEWTFNCIFCPLLRRSMNFNFFPDSLKKILILQFK